VLAFSLLFAQNTGCEEKEKRKRGEERKERPAEVNAIGNGLAGFLRFFPIKRKFLATSGKKRREGGKGSFATVHLFRGPTRRLSLRERGATPADKATSVLTPPSKKSNSVTQRGREKRKGKKRKKKEKKTDAPSDAVVNALLCPPSIRRS